MSACPNCGRETVRTEDWACQWCGYPLLSGSFKQVDKTYRELQEERLYGLVVEESEEFLSPEPAPSLLKQIIEPEVESVEEPEPATEPEPAEELAIEPEEVKEPEPVEEPEPVKEIEPVEEPVLEAEPAAPAMAVTVDDLLSAYEGDSAAADARFAGKTLSVTGVVARVEVGEFLDVHYIILASADQRRLQSIRCLFDKKHGEELSKLARGQTVTVQGTYYGSIIDIRLKDCTLVG